PGSKFCCRHLIHNITHEPHSRFSNRESRFENPLTASSPQTLQTPHSTHHTPNTTLQTLTPPPRGHNNCKIHIALTFIHIKKYFLWQMSNMEAGMQTMNSNLSRAAAW